RLELDSAPREVSVPADLAAALKKAKAREAFDDLAYTYRKEHVRSIEEAKAPETTPPSRRESRAERARQEGSAVRGRARHVQGAVSGSLDRARPIHALSRAEFCVV